MKVISESLKQKTLDPYELWAVAQLMPDEGIEDGVRRIKELLSGKPYVVMPDPVESSGVVDPIVVEGVRRYVEG